GGGGGGIFVGGTSLLRGLCRGTDRVRPVVRRRHAEVPRCGRDDRGVRRQHRTYADHPVRTTRSAAILGHSGPLARAGVRGGVSRRSGAAAAQWRIPMTTVTIEPAQRTAANVAGLIYL